MNGLCLAAWWLGGLLGRTVIGCGRRWRWKDECGGKPELKNISTKMAKWLCCITATNTCHSTIVYWYCCLCCCCCCCLAFYGNFFAVTLCSCNHLHLHFSFLRLCYRRLIYDNVGNLRNFRATLPTSRRKCAPDTCIYLVIQYIHTHIYVYKYIRELYGQLENLSNCKALYFFLCLRQYSFHSGRKQLLAYSCCCFVINIVVVSEFCHWQGLHYSSFGKSITNLARSIVFLWLLLCSLSAPPTSPSPPSPSTIFACNFAFVAFIAFIIPCQVFKLFVWFFSCQRSFFYLRPNSCLQCVSPVGLVAGKGGTLSQYYSGEINLVCNHCCWWLC